MLNSRTTDTIPQVILLVTLQLLFQLMKNQLLVLPLPGLAFFLVLTTYCVLSIPSDLLLMLIHYVSRSLSFFSTRPFSKLSR